MHAIRMTAALAATLLLGCSQSHTGSTTETGTGSASAPAEGDAAAAGETRTTGVDDAHEDLPPGVLARAQGRQGVIQVEERDGLRLLTISGQVHGAMPIGAAATPLSGDPAVQLVRAVRPDAKTALVIGLGTGKTARELERAGLEVEAVELEPVVVEFARKYFGYEGHAVVDDGIAYLDKTEKQWDVLLMDAAGEINPPPRLISEEAIALLRRRTARGGVTLLRKRGEPQDFVTKMIAKRLESRGGAGMAYVHVFGSGVGAEVQNLYFIASDKALNLVDISGLAMWPVMLMDMAPPDGIPTAPDGAAGQTGPERRVRLVGYLHIMPEGGALALDLPHWEMGAVRYLLSGALADGLRGKLGAHPTFPTEGDIGTDGDTSKTMKDVLGGGGTKRSDVRFSPVIVALEGTARLRSVVHPEAAGRLPPSMRRGARGDDRLPYGGALYDLEVSKVLWTLDRAGWKKLGRRLRPFVAKAEKSLRSGAFDGAAKQLEGYLGYMESQLFSLLPQHSEMKLLAAEVARVGSRVHAKPGSFELAAACDRTAAYMGSFELVSTDVVSLKKALRACARASYEKVAGRTKDPHAREAAARLLDIYEELGYGDEPGAERTYAKKRAALIAKYPGLEAATKPPAEEAPK